MNTLTKTMTRQQLFEIGNLDWVTSAIQKTRALEMKVVYEKLKDEKRLEFMEQFDDFLQMDYLSFLIITDKLVPDVWSTSDE